MYVWGTICDRDKCSKFIKKVSEDRFTKVKERQVRKLNSLINKTSDSKNNGIRSTGSKNNYNNGLGHNSQTQDSVNKNQTGNPNSNKWVINLSKTSLTKAQESLLAKGPNFTFTSSNIPNTDYITVVESISHKLKEQETPELRADINSLLRRTYTHTQT